MSFRLYHLESTVLVSDTTSPFSQRVWIALEAKKLPYQYIETDPSKRPASAQLLEANPKGTVPAIREGDWACSESTVILEYVSRLCYLTPRLYSDMVCLQLEDVDRSNPLFPSDPRLRANCRQWIHHVRVKPRFSWRIRLICDLD
jgi:glutathione S-transferase